LLGSCHGFEDGRCGRHTLLPLPFVEEDVPRDPEHPGALALRRPVRAGGPHHTEEDFLGQVVGRRTVACHSLQVPVDGPPVLFEKTPGQHGSLRTTHGANND
jgi:hypothetical protein